MKSLSFIVASFMTIGAARSATPTVAQESDSGTFDESALRDEQIFDLKLRPAAPTTPALRHRLFPNRSDTINRNAATFYYRAVAKAVAINGRIWRYNQANPDRKQPYLHDADVYWMDLPLDELPVDDMRQYVNEYTSVFEELERASISRFCHWDILPDDEEQISWFQLDLQEHQNLREVCRILSVAIRVAVADGDFDKAVGYLNHGFKIANNLESCEVLVISLVGIACGNLMMNELHLLMQAPGAPNLYWPLVDLPRPLVNCNHSIRRELEMLAGGDVFHSIKQRNNGNISAEGWRKLIARDMSVALLLDGPDEISADDFVSLVSGMFSVRGYPYAKASLIARGYDAKEVQAMPVGRVLALQQHNAAKTISDEVTAVLNLDYPNRFTLLQSVEDKLENQSVMQSPSIDSQLLPWTEQMMPAFQQVVFAEVRTQMHIAGLQVIEAIRSHAAIHGELPESLQDITCVPVPLNPATQKPFDYAIANGVGELQVFGPKEISFAYASRLYRLRLAK